MIPTDYKYLYSKKVAYQSVDIHPIELKKNEINVENNLIIIQQGMFIKLINMTAVCHFCKNSITQHQLGSSYIYCMIFCTKQ